MENIKKALQDQNFWLAVVLIIGGFWNGFSSEDATALISTLFVLIAGVGQFANFFKNAETDWKRWVTNSNFWTYLSVIVVGFVPTLDAELFNAIQRIATDAINQNWQGVIGGLFTLVTFVYKIITTPKDPD
jgi:hypothetical protein